MRKVSPTSQPAAPESTRSNLLYIEDEVANWQVTELRLQRDYQLLRAADAREACELMERYRGRLAAILMDIQLHGSDLDGIQLTRLFRGTLPNADKPAYAKDLAPVRKVPI